MRRTIRRLGRVIDDATGIIVGRLESYSAATEHRRRLLALSPRLEPADLDALVKQANAIASTTRHPFADVARTQRALAAEGRALDGIAIWTAVRWAEHVDLCNRGLCAAAPPPW